MVLLTLLAAILLPETSGYFQRKRASDTVTIFRSLQFSLVNQNDKLGAVGFVQRVQNTGSAPRGRYLGRLRHLLIPVTATDLDCSSTAYDATKRTAWTTNGPYGGLLITAGIQDTGP